MVDLLSDRKIAECTISACTDNKLAKPRSYASLKLRLTDSLTYLLTGVKCRATSVAKKWKEKGKR